MNPVPHIGNFGNFVNFGINPMSHWQEQGLVFPPSMIMPMPVRPKSPILPVTSLFTRAEDTENKPFVPPPVVAYEDHRVRALDFEPGEQESEPQPQQVQQQQLQQSHSEIPSFLVALKAYRFIPSKNDWKHINMTGLNVDKKETKQEKKARISSVRIITWNIAYDLDEDEERLKVALRHIEIVLECERGEEPEPCCILLQELKTEMLPYLLRNPFVRRHFIVTPLHASKWPTGSLFGNCTLVSRTLNIAECHILHFGYSRMMRSALCVKIKLNYPGSSRKAVIAIVNTHLESLPAGTPFRPKQLELCSRFLRVQGVYGGVVAGDMNAILVNDRGIEKAVHLKDSWRRGDVEEGKTWGFQGNPHNFPTGRLDKVFYYPREGYKVDEPRRVGINMRIYRDTPKAQWVSDHYGLETTLHMLPHRRST